MKFKKIFGLSIFTASVLGFIACANNHPAEIYNNEDFYQDHSTNPTANDGYCLLTFDANGGKLPDGRSSTYFQVRKGHNWKRIKDKHGIPPEDGEGMTPVANKEFKFWQTKDNKAIFDEYVFNEDSVTLTAKWGDAYNPSTFSTDSWDQVIEAANKGDTEEGLQIYSKELENNSFIIEDLNNVDEVKSKTRYVTIDGLINPLYAPGSDIPTKFSWPVHVIGVNHDLIKDSPKTVAALTFEFNYSPIPAIGWDYSSEVGHQSWEKSTLRDYLNSYFYLQFEDGLQSGIQTVCKNTDDGTNQDNTTSIEEKIFIPSVSEVGDEETLAYSGTEASTYENSRYQYYVQHHFAKDLVKTNPYVLVGGKPSSTTAWFRSPHLLKDTTLQDSSAMTISLTEEGTSYVITNEEVNIPHAVCPCFAIGENPVCAVVSNISDGLTFEAVDNFAQIGTNFVARLKANDPFSGYRPPTVHGLDGKIKITVNGVTKVLVDGQDYTYKPGLSALGILTIKSNAISEGATLITIDADPVADRFQTDPWETVVAKANEGVDAFIEYYEIRRESLVGSQKYLTIDGVKYRTRIIDYGYDPLADDNGTATLTFEFVDAIGDAGVYDNETNEDFRDSELNFRLSSFAQDKIPFELAEVKKPICTKTGDRWELNNYNAKLFPLSLGEIRSDPGREVPTRPERAQNECYRYYGQQSTYSKYLPGTQKKIPNWLRTPNANNVYAIQGYPNVMSIDGVEGKLVHDSFCYDDKYVAPGFCIGRNYDTANITFSGATDAFTIDYSDPETITVPVDHNYTISKIAAKEVCGETPTITKDNVFLTANGSIFTDWDLVSYGDNDYDIVLNNVPTNGVDVNITFPTQYLSVRIDKKAAVGEEGPATAIIGFEKGDSAPDTQLSYSTNGINFNDYEYGTPLQLNELSDTVYFKAREGANNTTFSNGIENFSSYEMLNNRITQFVSNRDGPGWDPYLQIEGNIMSLLGDGTSVPSSIDARGAFAGMFSNNSYVGDISGLTFTATGTSQTNSDASGAYAYMFYNCDILTYEPAKITGFNDYSDTNIVESTYRGMFASSPNTDPEQIHADIDSMPYCDFSKTCPHMCENMFAYCPYLTDFNNVVTDQFNRDYSEACFSGMFRYAGFNSDRQGVDADVPVAIGSEEMDAADKCCYEMFEGAMIRKSPNMMCNTPAAQSFFRCFADCRALNEISLTINEIGGAMSESYEEFAALTEAPLEDPLIFTLYLYGLSNLSVWPGVGGFENWINGRDDRGNDSYTLYANSNVISALEAGYGPSSVFESWKKMPLPSTEIRR